MCILHMFEDTFLLDLAQSDISKDIFLPIPFS